MICMLTWDQTSAYSKKKHEYRFGNANLFRFLPGTRIRHAQILEVVFYTNESKMTLNLKKSSIPK